jgi:tetratricopeptide (TPR) repeat protein
MANMKRTDALLGKLCGEMRRGFEASESGNPAEALKIYQGVLEKAQALGLESGFVLWNLAIVADNLGELEMAFDYIRRALAADPLAQPFQNSFDVVVKRIRAVLADEARKVDDPSTPRLYDILAGAGEADVASHVAMARWCAAGGDVVRAGKLAEALVTLYPGEPLAWRCKADVARASGDAATADECMAEAAVRGGTPEPFAVPGVARG